jgi:hypothetical protein
MGGARRPCRPGLPLLTERRPFNVDALRYFTAKGLELGALDVLCGPDDETLPWIRPSAALRAWMARESAPSAFTTSLEESGLAVTGAGEVVVPAALAAVDWADLCALCSLVSLDRAAILRPTRDSVAAAVRADLSVEGFLARLERLSGGSVPQAVDFQVRDWGVSRSVDVRLAVLVQAADRIGQRTSDLGKQAFSASALSPVLDVEARYAAKLPSIVGDDWHVKRKGVSRQQCVQAADRLAAGLELGSNQTVRGRGVLREWPSVER